MHIEYFTHDTYKEEYIEDEEFKQVFQQRKGQIYMKNVIVRLNIISKMG